MLIDPSCADNTNHYQNARFCPADQVYVRVPGTTMREGPSTVTSVDNQQYKLCNEKGNQVKGNSWSKEEELEFCDPFG
jgi:hypothetical protein